jgi:hypothetical protein
MLQRGNLRGIRSAQVNAPLQRSTLACSKNRSLFGGSTSVRVVLRFERAVRIRYLRLFAVRCLRSLPGSPRRFAALPTEFLSAKLRSTLDWTAPAVGRGQRDGVLKVFCRPSL